VIGGFANHLNSLNQLGQDTVPFGEVVCRPCFRCIKRNVIGLFAAQPQSGQLPNHLIGVSALVA
jgi:hypothetical protein